MNEPCQNTQCGAYEKDDEYNCGHILMDDPTTCNCYLISKKASGAEVPCNVGLSAQLKIATDALNMIGSGTEDSLPPYRAMGTSQMKDVAYKALTEINAIDEVSR